MNTMSQHSLVSDGGERGNLLTRSIYRTQPLRLVLVFAGVFGINDFAHAVESVAPLFAGLSIGLPQGVTPPPGVYYSNTAIILSGYRVDGSGNKGVSRTSLAEDASSILVATPFTILGGRYSFIVAKAMETTSIWTSAGQSSPSSGAFNTYIAPIDLGYKLTDDLSVRIGAGVFLPDGNYNSVYRHTSNGYATIQPTLGLTYLKNGYSFTAYTRFNINFENPNTNYKSGNLFNVELTATKSFGPLTIGPAAYLTDQYGNDVRNGLIVPATATNSIGNKEFQVAVGSYLSYDFKSFALSATFMQDVMARNYSRNTSGFLRISLPLGNPFGPTRAVAPAQIQPESDADVNGDKPRSFMSFGVPLDPAFTWAGAYAGGHFGYDLGASRSATYAVETDGPLSARSASMHGEFGGAHAGYLFATRLAPALQGSYSENKSVTEVVFGAELDVDGTSSAATYPLLTRSITDSVQENVQGSIRGRLGATFGRFMAYGTGGVAVSDLENTYKSATGVYDRAGRTMLGYTVGGGVEYALVKRLALRAEYRFTDFGSLRDNLASASGGAVSVSHVQLASRVTLGFSYRFINTPVSTVTARY